MTASAGLGHVVVVNGLFVAAYLIGHVLMALTCTTVNARSIWHVNVSGIDCVAEVDFPLRSELPQRLVSVFVLRRDFWVLVDVCESLIVDVETTQCFVSIKHVWTLQPKCLILLGQQTRLHPVKREAFCAFIETWARELIPSFQLVERTSCESATLTDLFRDGT